MNDSRTSEHVSGPSVTNGSNPQDSMEPTPDHSRQEFSCLRHTICGSVCPGEKHEIGNVNLPHLGGDDVESGQSCPELGWLVRLCVPTDKHDKGLSKQGQNRKRRDHPDSPRLAVSGVVPGHTRSRDRLSNISPVLKLLKQTFSMNPGAWEPNYVGYMSSKRSKAVSNG